MAYLALPGTQVGPESKAHILGGVSSPVKGYTVIREHLCESPSMKHDQKCISSWALPRSG